jgi:hypothetical protein
MKYMMYTHKLKSEDHLLPPICCKRDFGRIIKLDSTDGLELELLGLGALAIESFGYN